MFIQLILNESWNEDHTLSPFRLTNCEVAIVSIESKQGDCINLFISSTLWTKDFQMIAENQEKLLKSKLEKDYTLV